MGLEDISARASTVGEYFQFVALPKDGRLVIFLDDAVSNAPAAGARIEILAGDAIVTAEEAAPRSEERRVGKEGVSTCRSRRSPHHSNTQRTSRQVPHETTGTIKKPNHTNKT